MPPTNTDTDIHVDTNDPLTSTAPSIHGAVETVDRVVIGAATALSIADTVADLLAGQA